MTKKSIIFILLIVLSIGIVSLYSTFAFDEDNSKLEESTADSNLIFSINKSSGELITVNAGEEKYVEIPLVNNKEVTLRYGMYYYVLNESVFPNNLLVTLAEDSTDKLENIIKPNDTKIVSIKIVNNEDHAISLVIDDLTGFENGKIEDLVKNGEILIK